MPFLYLINEWDDSLFGLDVIKVFSTNDGETMMLPVASMTTPRPMCLYINLTKRAGRERGKISVVVQWRTKGTTQPHCRPPPLCARICTTPHTHTHTHTQTHTHYPTQTHQSFGTPVKKSPSNTTRKEAGMAVLYSFAKAWFPTRGEPKLYLRVQMRKEIARG